jgi:hypothetical protein
VDRLAYIINVCPALAVPALQLATQHIFKTRDTDLYRSAAGAYDTVAANAQLPPAAEVAPLDQAWQDEWTSKNLSERSRLEVELKTYTSNMIKESIRVRFSSPLGEYYSPVIHRRRWLTEISDNFTYPLVTTPVPLNTSQRSGNRARPVNMLSICALRFWRSNFLLLKSWSAGTHEVGFSF